MRLHEEGLIYRAKRLVNWDPVLQTALSDLEVRPRKSNGRAVAHRAIRSPTATGELVVATTRPETMLGDTAVAVHPDDSATSTCTARSVALPLDRSHDSRSSPTQLVDLAFGTGAVKVTPAHDFNDYEIGKRHELPMINIFDARTARSTSNAPAQYRGHRSFRGAQGGASPTSRRAGLARRRSKPHKLTLPRSQRSAPWSSRC